MIRRAAILVLSLFVILSVGGALCAQAQSASAAGCCKSSCPKSQQRDPVKCCNVHIAQGTVEVPSVNHGAPDPTQMAALNPPAHSLSKLELKAAAFEKIHPPPGPALSPEHLCSLQI
jgi:hypothetical protein